MVLLIRHVSHTNKWAARWQQTTKDAGYLNLLSDFDGNEISVFVSDESQEAFNNTLGRLAAASVSTRQSISNFYWIAVSQNHVDAADLHLSQTAGKTPDPEVNSWHRDINLTSPTQLFSLVDVFLMHGKGGFVREQDVKKNIEIGFTEGYLQDFSRLQLKDLKDFLKKTSEESAKRGRQANDSQSMLQWLEASMSI